MAKTFTALSNTCLGMVKLLNWQTYHTPENLAALLVGEVGELSELCVWLTKDQIISNAIIKKRVTEELADVVKGTIFLFNSLHMPTDVETLILHKLHFEDIKYPVKEYKGKSKYEKLNPTKRRYKDLPPVPVGTVERALPIKDLEDIAWENSSARSWEKYYTPASLCLGMFEDCSKIFTSFQRRTNAIEKSYERLIWAIAGILILALRLRRYLGLDDLYLITAKKISADSKRFKQRRSK